MRSAFLVAALILAMGAGPVVIFIVTALGPVVIDRFDLSKAEFGGLASLPFLSAAVFSFLLGRAVDAISPRLVVITLYMAAVGALLLLALGSQVHILALALIVSGVVQALANPVTNRMVAAHLNPGRRGVIMGVKQSGVQMSQLAAGVFAPTLALAFGWATPFVAAIPIALLGVGLAIGTLAGRAQSTDVAVRRRTPGEKLPTAVWFLAGYAILTGAALQASNIYLPLFAYETMGWSLGLAALTVSLLAAMGIGARILWGHWSERLPSIHGPLLAVAGGGVVAVATLLLAAVLEQGWLLWTGVALLGTTGVAVNAVVMVALLGLVPLRLVGRASGLLATGLFLGFTLGPMSAGWIIDASGGYVSAWALSGVVYLAAFGLAAWMRKKVTRTR